MGAALPATRTSETANRLPRLSMASSGLSRNVPRINIVKLGEAARSEVQFVFNSVGTQNPKDVLISGSSGTEEQTVLFIGYRDCEVPFKGTLTYTVAAALGSSDIESYLEFEINEPGVWRVQIQTY